jgi:hypothetical protein
VSCKDHCDRFYHYLRYKGVRTRPHTIVNAIAEKVNVAYPGICKSTMHCATAIIMLLFCTIVVVCAYSDRSRCLVQNSLLEVELSW